MGLFRVLFAFPVGVLLHRAYESGRLDRLPKLRLLALVAVLALVLTTPLHHAAGDEAVDLTCILLLFPALLALAVKSDRPSSMGERLGAMSYPLYATHLTLVPIWMLLLPSLPPALGLLLMMAGSMAVASGVKSLLEWSPHRPAVACA